MIQDVKYCADVILVKLTTAAQVVDSEKGHLLSSMRLEAQVQKGFIRLYDFGPPHAVGELWVFQCSNRSKPLPLSEKIPDKEYAELAVEKVKPPPKQVTYRWLLHASNGPSIAETTGWLCAFLATVRAS